MENEFLRDSWNKRISKDQFFKEVSENYSCDNILKLIRILEGFCADENTSPYFYEYFGSLVEHYLSMSLADINFDNQKQIKSYYNLFRNYGKSLFNSCTLGNKEDARAALNAVRVALVHPYYGEIQSHSNPISLKQQIAKTLDILIPSHNFLLLLSTSRLLDSEYHAFVRNLYLEINPFEHSNDDSGLLLSSFNHAFVDTKASMPIFHHKVDIPYVGVLFIEQIENLYDVSVLVHFFCNYLKKYYEVPNIVLGYGAMKTIQVIFKVIDQEHKNEIVSNKDKLKIIIQNECYNSMALPFSNDIDKLYDYLFSKPIGFDSAKVFDESHFIANFLTTPSLCVDFSDMIISRIQTGTVDFFNDLSSNFDYYFCIYAQHKSVALLSEFIKILPMILNKDVFASAFYFFSSFFMCNCSLFNRNEMDEFVQAQDSDFKTLLSFLLLEYDASPSDDPKADLEKSPGLPLPLIDSSTPLQKCINFISIVSQMDAYDILVQVQDNPFLMLLALIDGIKQSRKDLIILTKMKTTSMILHVALIHYLNVISHPPNDFPCDFQFLYVNYSIFKTYPIPTIQEIESSILKDLYFYFKYTPASVLESCLSTAKLNYWFDVYGIKTIIECFFKVVSTDQFAPYKKQLFVAIYLSMLCMSLISWKQGLAMGILLSMFEIDVKYFEQNYILIGQFFFHIFQCLNIDEMRLILDKVYERIDQDQPQDKMMLATMTFFFRCMTYSPKLLKMLRKDIYQAFLKFNNYKGFMDYFIRLEKIKDNDNSET